MWPKPKDFTAVGFSALQRRRREAECSTGGSGGTTQAPAGWRDLGTGGRPATSGYKGSLQATTARLREEREEERKREREREAHGGFQVGGGRRDERDRQKTNTLPGTGVEES